MAAPAQPPALETLYASRNVKEGGEKFYVTTAINYTNGNPHIGHAYEGMLADVSARYNRAYGRDVFFLTGTDEHGQKIARSAEGKGMTPKELCDLYAGNFQKLNKRMSISNDDYIRTTDRYHEDTARELWKRCSANKNAAGEPDIYLGEYVGWYNEREEQFITEKDAKKTDFKDAYGAPLKKVSEKCYFFRLSAYKQRLVDYYTQKPEAIMPAERREEVMKMLEGDLEDLCVSRTTFDWGIRLPEGFEENHVMYVWFDALTNYVSATHLLLPDEQSDPKRRALWPANIHIVGKDITRFHCIYWPAMLWSAGLPLPGSVSGHGFVMDGEGKKMSKSQGNVVDPHDLLDKYPADSVRYYCCNAASYGSDMKCSELGLISDNNTLADQFGNLAQRAVNMVQKEFGKVPEKPEGVVLPAPYDTQPPFDLVKLRESVDECMKVMDVKSALNLIQEATGEANAFINKTEPYKMKDAAQAPARQLCLRLMLESLYALTHFLAPFLPETATRIFNKISPGKAIEDLTGTFDNLQVGREITAGPWAEGMDVLFPKLLSDEERAKQEQKAAAKQAAAAKPAKEPKATAKPGGKAAKAAKAPAEVKPEFGADGWRSAVKSEVDKRWYLKEFNGTAYPEVSGVLTLNLDGIFDQAVYSKAADGTVHTEAGSLSLTLLRTGGIKYDPKTGKAVLKPHHSTIAAELAKDGNPTFDVRVSKGNELALESDGERSVWTRKRQL
eukprot:TRINITY_DN8432_c0_g1_i1.p1 TRINITY_DN8432_c0_g1~~TRINITY_DN8432_c0_g1_i1.p1  ORF type:complete len:743 (+),score=334.91 TRINITY_DN8432_c0_g1_i1:49-2229(+)